MYIREIHIENVRGFGEGEQGLTLPLRDLGEGLKTTTSLVLDIIKQINLAHGDVALEISTDGVRVRNEGVVLIDEADAHLHVSWQQKIGFWLKRHFPDIQFLVTTHSPFICQAADSLIRLAPIGSGLPVAEPVSEDIHHCVVNGSADDAVMTALFGLERPYSEASEQLRRRIADLEAKLIRAQITPEEESELAEKKQRLPSAGSAMVEVALRALKATG